VNAADQLVDRIVTSARIPSGKRRREIQRELRAHIEDFADAARDAGHDQHEIDKLVLANFGDPAQIAQAFGWVYRHERRRLQIFIYALSTALLASSLLVAVLAMQAGLAVGFGTPIVHVFASRHTLIEAFDVLAAVAVYLGVRSLERIFERHRFQKAASLLTLIITVLIAACTATGLRTSFLIYGLIVGVFYRAVQLFVTPKLARIAIVAVCFPLAGLVSTLLRAPASPAILVATCASWLVMGAGYQLMTYLAAPVDRALLNTLQRT